ncbi:MAG TPA: PaaI family thioesterase [Candidatus Limnocylindria bacterium]|nr:PaaI family thioesterase [Candidatus Limnocylindria bacterium]
MNRAIAGTFPGLVGIEYLEVAHAHVVSRLDLRAELLAPTNGLLHGGVLVTIADSACGIGAAVSLPDGARGHATVELKANFLGSVRDGTLRCEAQLIHAGRSTQVWDATVTEEATGKTVAVFRCTQLVMRA